MDAAVFIRNSVSEVERLRLIIAADAGMRSAVAAVKRYQSQRFENSYRDLIAGGPYQAAAHFFLNELYGVVDYSKRDAQFARIAGAIESLLPRQAISTAVALARLHLLTEQLDFAMAGAWQSAPSCEKMAATYVRTWKAVGHREERERQLQLVLELGRDLSRLTRTPGIRLMLKVMRGPAHAAGLHELQAFLEIGFDTFAALARYKGGTEAFLLLIEARESELIRALFDSRFDILTSLRDGVLPAGTMA